MAQALTVQAEAREVFGKNASRRLRRAGRIPAVVYGEQGPTVPLLIDPKQVWQVLHSDSGQNAILTLEMPGRAPARAMIKDYLVDPVRGDLLHVDFVRIARETRLKVSIPVHVVGEATGVKVQSGILELVLREIEVECLPDDIPEHFTADVTELVIGKNLRVADLPISSAVKVLTDAQRVVAHVIALKAEEVAPAAAEAAEEAAPAEPEVIRKGKAETEEESEAKEKEPGKTK